jgi:hypothetical protein
MLASVYTDFEFFTTLFIYIASALGVFGLVLLVSLNIRRYLKARRENLHIKSPISESENVVGRKNVLGVNWVKLFMVSILISVVVTAIVFVVLQNAKGTLVLEPTTIQLRAADMVTGTVRVIPKKDFKALRLITTLTANEVWEASNGSNSNDRDHSVELFTDEIIVEISRVFKEGKTEYFEFKLGPIPKGLVPVHGKKWDSKIVWELKTHLDCEGIDLRGKSIRLSVYSW